MKREQQEYWPLAEAKNRFSEVAQSALKAPQKIFRRAGNVVVLSEETYRKLIGETMDFKAFLLHETPDLKCLNLTRNKSPMRDIEL